MLDNLLHLVTFYESNLVSLWNFQPILVYIYIYIQAELFMWWDHFGRRCLFLLMGSKHCKTDKISVCVTYWSSTELSIRRCTSVNNRCIRSKISGYHLDLWTSWIQCNCNAHWKQVDIKQLYNQVPQTAWVSWSSSCSSRQREPAPDRGLRPSGPWLSSPAEWGRSAAILRGTWDQYVAVCAVSNSPLTHNQYQPFCNPFENKVWEVYFSKEECSFVIIVDDVSAYICIRIVVSWLYNMWTAKEAMLKNKPPMIIFYERIFVSLCTFQPNLR